MHFPVVWAEPFMSFTACCRLEVQGHALLSHFLTFLLLNVSTVFFDFDEIEILGEYSPFPFRKIEPFSFCVRCFLMSAFGFAFPAKYYIGAIVSFLDRLMWRPVLLSWGPNQRSKYSSISQGSFQSSWTQVPGAHTNLLPGPGAECMQPGTLD